MKRFLTREGISQDWLAKFEKILDYSESQIKQQLQILLAQKTLNGSNDFTPFRKKITQALLVAMNIRTYINRDPKSTKPPLSIEEIMAPYTPHKMAPSADIESIIHDTTSLIAGNLSISKV